MLNYLLDGLVVVFNIFLNPVIIIIRIIIIVIIIIAIIYVETRGPNFQNNQRFLSYNRWHVRDDCERPTSELDLFVECLSVHDK